MSPIVSASPIINPSIRYSIENPNCMNRFVQWLIDDETSTTYKVGVLALAVLSLIGASFLAGYPAILAFLPLAIWAVREWTILSENVLPEITGEGAAHALEKMKQAVGGEEYFNELGVLELDRPYTASIDWLKPENLDCLIMRGTHFNRQFIAIVVNDAEQQGTRLVLTFFQKHSQDGAAWSHRVAGGLPNDPFGEKIEEKDLKILRQIILHRNHPRFSLAIPPNQWFDPTEMLARNGDLYYAAQKRVRDALGGKEYLERLFYIYPDKIFSRGDHLEPGDLPTPIVKGLAMEGGNFYALKVTDSELNREVVITFFTTTGEGADGGRWSHNILGVNAALGDGTVQAEMIRQIVHEKNHPRYTLADFN